MPETISRLLHSPLAGCRPICRSELLSFGQRRVILSSWFVFLPAHFHSQGHIGADVERTCLNGGVLSRDFRPGNASPDGTYRHHITAAFLRR